MTDEFRKFANKGSAIVGSPFSFVISVLIVVIWACTGPFFHFSDTWQLVINSGTSIITFLMVFLIQNTQNRDARAIHLKLDELIRANAHARNHLIDLQTLSDKELDTLHNEFCKLNQETEERIEKIQETRHRIASKRRK
jgi:low affinity Fe/Cu permease